MSANQFKIDTPIRFRTQFGVLDVLNELPTIGPYDLVRKNARRYEFEGITLIVADITDIRRSKEAADRVKDIHTLDALRAAEERLRQEGDPYELPRERLDDEGEDNG